MALAAGTLFASTGYSKTWMDLSLVKAKAEIVHLPRASHILHIPVATCSVVVPYSHPNNYASEHNCLISIPNGATIQAITAYAYDGLGNNPVADTSSTGIVLWRSVPGGNTRQIEYTGGQYDVFDVHVGDQPTRKELTGNVKEESNVFYITLHNLISLKDDASPTDDEKAHFEAMKRYGRSIVMTLSIEYVQ